MIWKKTGFELEYSVESESMNECIIRAHIELDDSGCDLLKNSTSPVR